MTNIIYGRNHSSILNKAIDDAKSELYITSYGITSYGLTFDLIKKIHDKAANGVNFYFVVGVSDKYTQSMELGKLFYLQYWTIKHNYTGNIFLSVKEDKHGKVLIKDCDFAVVGSYNWLTSQNNNWDNYSTVLSDKNDIQTLKDLILNNNSMLIENLKLTKNNILEHNFGDKKVTNG